MLSISVDQHGKRRVWGVVVAGIIVGSCSEPPRSDPNPAPSTISSEGGSTISVTTAERPACATIAEHWRTVWTTEARVGIERRARRAADYAAQEWLRTCNKHVPAISVLEDMLKLRTFSAIANDPQSGGEIRRLLVVTMQGLALKSQLAYAVAASGANECEDAFVDAAFCGSPQDVGKRVKEVEAKQGDAAACRAYLAELATQCPGQ